jgi:hypothetical protein
MTTPINRAEEIAAKLSEAQRTMLLRFPAMAHSPAWMIADGQMVSATIAQFARRHSDLVQKQRGSFALEYRRSGLGNEVARILTHSPKDNER